MLPCNQARQVKTFYNNSKVNRTLPLSALKVNEKDIQDVHGSLCEASHQKNQSRCLESLWHSS